MEKGEPPEPPIARFGFWRKGLKILAFSFLLLLICLAISVLFLQHYLQSNQSKIFEKISFLQQASVSFDQAEIDLLRNFPQGRISIQKISLQDSLYALHHAQLLLADQVDIRFSLLKLWENEIELRDIILSNACIHMLRTADDYNNLSVFAGEEVKQNTGFKLRRDQLRLRLNDVEVLFEDHIRGSKILVCMLDTKADVKFSEGLVHTELDLESKVSEMTFNLEKGSFLRNSSLRGALALQVENNKLTIDPAELEINENPIIFEADINLDRKLASRLIFEGDELYLNNIKPLLPQIIREKLKPYRVEGGFYAKAEIQSHFQPNENAYVQIAFDLPGNEVQTYHRIFPEANVKGTFKNRFYEDERLWKEERGKAKVEINHLVATYDEFLIRSKQTNFTSTPGYPVQIETEATVTGSPAGISNWLENDEFLFDEKGAFNLDLNVTGPLRYLNQLVVASNAELDLQDIAVIYKPARVVFPLERLMLSKRSGEANFSILNRTLEERNTYRMDGGLSNIPALILELAGQQVDSEVEFQARKIGWKDFLDLFGEDGYLKNKKSASDEQKRKSMKETIYGIQENFRPKIAMDIESLTYYDILKLNDFKTQVYFKDTNTLMLDETSFSYGNGQVKVKGSLDISQINITPFEVEIEAENINLKELLPSLNYLNVKLLKTLEDYPENLNFKVVTKGIIDDIKGLIPNSSTGRIDFSTDVITGTINYEPSVANAVIGDYAKTFIKTTIDLEGDPEVFNGFFENDEFFFSKGKFKTRFDYTGDVASFEELLNKSNATFSLENSEVFYKSVGLSFPLTQIDLKLYEDQADFDLFLYEDSIAQSLAFKGKVENISELLLGNTGKSFRTTVDISTPKIIWKPFLSLFESPSQVEEKENLPEEQVEADGLKATVKALLTTFDPNMHAQIDTFVYSDQLQVREVITGLRLVDSTALILEETGFKFLDGGIRINGELDLSNIETLPFSVKVNTDDLDVAKLFESLDYLSIPALQEVEKLEGRITLNMDLKSQIRENGKGLIPEETEARMEFDVHNVELMGLSVIDSLARKLKARKRFQNLLFAPISNTITLKNNEINIPITEVQSNALHMFVEGKVGLDGETKVWLSIPTGNLKLSKRDKIPPKQGYPPTSNLLHIEILTDSLGQPNYKFHLSKKKYYEDLGIPEQYKLDKQAYKQLRKEIKKSN